MRDKNGRIKKRKKHKKRSALGFCICALIAVCTVSAVLVLLFPQGKKSGNVPWVPYGTTVMAADICPGGISVLSAEPSDGAYLLITGRGVYLDTPGEYSLRVENGNGELCGISILVKDCEAPYIRTVTQSVETGRVYDSRDLVVGGDRIDSCPDIALSCDKEGVRILSKGHEAVFLREGTYTLKAVVKDASNNRLEKNVMIRTRYAGLPVSVKKS